MPFHHHRGLLFAAAITLLFACGKHLSHKTDSAKVPPPPPVPNMEEPTQRHTGDYQSEWKIIDSLEQGGLYKSALEQTEALYARAKRDKNAQQVVKTLLFRGKYTTLLEEDGLVKAIQALETETKASAQPERAVLQSLLGELYATYLRNSAWQIGNRTPIPDGEGGDILTWSTAQIERHALDLYAASVADATLKAIPVDRFRDVTTQGQLDTVQSPLRPTLYDLLAHRALSYFGNERSYLSEPAYAFVLDQPAAFAPASDFVKTAFESRDSTSGKWLGLRLFQQVLSVHLNDANPAALIDADLLRLQFAYQNSVRDDKDDQYLRALEALHKRHAAHPSDAEIVHLIATHRVGNTAGDKGQNARAAVAECEDAIRRHPNSYGANLCRQLLASIRAISLQATVESVYLPQQALLVALEIKNLSKAWVRVVPGGQSQNDLESIPWENRLEHLKARPNVQTRIWDIPPQTDYQQHRTEIALAPLPLGRYWVMVSSNAEFDSKKGPVTFASFTCSNLAPIAAHEGSPYNSEPQRQLFIIANRQTGQPLSGVQLACFQRDYRRGNGELSLVATASTDERGMARPDLPEGVYAEVRATLGKDTLWVGNATNHRSYYGENNRPAAHYFTDRAIYRPGQTIYYKGILYRRNSPNEPPILVPNQKVTVKLYDANGQEKAQVSLKTNAFGTFNGSFAAPAGGLTGSMSIRADEADGMASFNVEEYKRPKFEVALKPLEGNYRLGSKVALQGEAKAYAGSNVDGAIVRYRVVRQARFPYWDYGFWWKRAPSFNSTAQEIAQGEAKTDANGAFEIPFELIPDLTVPKKDQPVFDYTVSVDVVDISGETRSTTGSVTAGYAALEVEWNLKADMELDSLKTVKISTLNRAGKAQPVEGRVTVTKFLEAKLFKTRYWEKPDVHTIAAAEFRQSFPDMAWKDEDDPKQWPRQDFDRPVAFNTGNTQPVNLHDGKMQTGWYLIKLSCKDAFGETVEREQVVRVWDAKDARSRFAEPSASVEKDQLEPGATARFWLGSRWPNFQAFFARERNGILDDPRWLRLDGASAVEIPVEESDRGNLVAHWFAVRDNRFYGGDALTVVVPWSNKDLQVSFETFRDRLAPGQREEWRVKISGPKKEKVAAEMVAALYDASLDQFLPHGWGKLPFPAHYAHLNFQERRTFGAQGGETRYEPDLGASYTPRSYQNLNWFDFPMYGERRMLRMAKMQEVADYAAPSAPPGAGAPEVMFETAAVAGNATAAVDDAPPPPPVENAAPKAAPFPAPIRRNLNETTFFFPELRTDAEGNVLLKFTAGESLTRWKLLTYAHTQTLQQALSVREVVTQKELMVLPNAPRFLRQGDVIEFSAKVSNLSQENISGKATLSLLDAATLQPLEKVFGLTDNRTVSFEAATGRSAALAWKVKVPDDFSGAVTWQVFAEGKSARDGEEGLLPVVANRTLVTETLPISLRGKQQKTFVFDNFKNGAKASSTLNTHTYTIEFSSNPAWYAVQALPYLMEYPHECSEQVFSRFYANALAANVTEKLPNIRRIYERWKGTDALKSNLQKNQELKTALLEETPWVLEAQSEAQQKQNIALLFDLNRMADERERALSTLSERQNNDGGWPWFPGGQSDRYITQYLLAGFAHLERLGALDRKSDQRLGRMVDKALGYGARKLQEQYDELQRLAQAGKAKLEDDHLDGAAIQYLYARSFYVNPAQGAKPDRLSSYYLDQAARYWLGKGLYQEGMLALALHRFGRPEAAQKITASLRERALVKEELGMYWPFDWGYYWYQLPVETQALMVEVFQEVAKDPTAVENLRIWLLKNKQTNRWSSTKATAEAVHALLLGGGDWLADTKTVQVELGGRTLKPTEVEPGTGYFKQQWHGAEVKPSWATLKVENPNPTIVWGAAYWQYFENLDKIGDFQKTPLKIVKQLFREENGPNGPVLKPISDGAALHRGDKIKVRIELRVDRPMEYVHLKDMRAAGLEPTNVLSGYRWQGGLGYYESTKDLATHFFIDYLPRGTFVFEYPLVANLKGDFSNGIATLQCMYAPEFTSHSAGMKVVVE